MSLYALLKRADMNTRLAVAAVTLAACVPVPWARAKLGGCTSLTQVCAVDPGGSQSYVVADSGYILLADLATNRLRLYRVSNPANPVLPSTIPIEDETDAIALDMNSRIGGACFGSGRERDLNIYDYADPGIYIFSLADPTSPHLLSITPTGPLPMRMAVANNVVYLVSWIRNIYAYDVSDPYHPQFASIVTSPLSIVNVAARFNAVYSVETNTCGLHVYDMVDPYHPRWIDSHNPPYSPWDVDVMQGMLVVADRTNGFEIFQLSDCSRCPPDLAEPTGRLDFFDVQAFLRLFAQQHRATNLDVNAVWDYADVVLSLEEFSRGCP